MSEIGSGPGRSSAQNVDRHVGARIRERRIMLGLTQQQFGELIGVTYQDAHKYEKGINRVAAGMLYHIAQALGVDVGYFFEGLGGGVSAFEPTEDEELTLDAVRYFGALSSRRQKEGVRQLLRALVDDGHAREA